MANLKGKARSKFELADIAPIKPEGVSKFVLSKCESSYLKATVCGDDWFTIPTASVAVSDIPDTKDLSEKLKLEVQKKLTDVKDVKFGKATLYDFNGAFGGAGVVYYAAYIAITEKGVKEMNDRIHREETPVLKRMGRALGLIS